MNSVKALLLWCCAGAVFAQSGTVPKPKPEDYEAHAQARSAALGAEFMVHSFSRGEESYIAEDYLVVEVALYPPKGQAVAVNPGNFSLRINGKKQVLLPLPPSMVAASLQHPEWRTSPTIEGGGGIGNTGVVLGGPPRNREPFPGSNPPGSGPVNMPRSPVPDNRGGVEPQERVKPEDLLVQTALPAGSHRDPVSGFLYFPYTGKIKSIKTLELLCEDAVVKLR